MSTTATTVSHANVMSTHYEPFHGFDAVLDGEPEAGVAWLRTEPGGDGVLYAGMFIVRPSTFRYTFAGDETFHVLDGDVDIAIDGGETVQLAPGDIASFVKGARSTWTVRTPLRKFFVISG